MEDWRGWIWRPIREGIFRGEGLYDGSISLRMIAEANDALDVHAENQWRMQQAARAANND